MLILSAVMFCAFFFIREKTFLSGYESRKSLWLSDMTSVFIFFIVHSESLRQKMSINQQIFYFPFEFAAYYIP